MAKKRALLLLYLTGLLTLVSPAMPVSAAWKTTKAGRMYTQSASPGYVTGWKQISSKWYYFNSKGIMQTGWVTIGGKRYFLAADGSRQTGWLKYNNRYYYLNKNGVMQTGKIKYKGNYYFLNENGVMQTNGWVAGGDYYASISGTLLKGINVVGNSVYYFNSKCKKVTKKLKQVDSDTYYFKPDGTAARSEWVRINSKFYYFQDTGVMAVNTWIGINFVGSDGVLTKQKKTTGWQTIDGSKYYYNSKGKAVTGWQDISGGRYYFNSSGAMQTGLQTIDGSQYYFYSDGRLAVSTTIEVGAHQYTLDSRGVVINDVPVSVPGSDIGVQIANYALQFVGNPYVYGGTSLTKGADCSGFVQTVFSKFGFKLLRVADDQMHGPSSANINSGYTRAVTVSEADMLPGDLIFYGKGDYANHVAIYIGDGKIVHASNSQPYPAGGIKISNYNYQQPIRIVRYWS